MNVALTTYSQKYLRHKFELSIFQVIFFLKYDFGIHMYHFLKMLLELKNDD